MINRIKLTNFQIHESLELMFNEGVNAIIGSSDCGKSAVIRALRFVLQNKPNGDAFIRHGENFTKVELDIDKHKIIMQKKGQTRECFFDDLVNPLSGFGQKIPSQIENLNFSDLNFQFQFDRPFLLDDSGGEVGRFFNRCIDLDIIDTSLSAMDGIRRTAKHDYEAKMKQKESLEAEIQSLGWINIVEKKLNFLIIQQKKIEKREELLRRLIPIIDTLKKVMAARDKKKLLDSTMLEAVYQRVQRNIERRGNVKRVNDLVILIKNVEEKKKINYIQDSIYESIDLSDCYKKSQDLTKRKNNLKNTALVMSFLTASKKNLAVKLEKQSFLDQELKSIKIDVCPIHKCVCPIEGVIL